MKSQYPLSYIEEDNNFVIEDINLSSIYSFIEISRLKPHKVLRLYISKENTSYIEVIFSNFNGFHYFNDYYYNENTATIETILKEKIAKYEYTIFTKEKTICYFKIINQYLLLRLI